ncbi:MAG: PDZ domain-containing protein [Clostridia bacterium]|nr:PDZ domain-containing protein [Clostridia bacterium]
MNRKISLGVALTIALICTVICGLFCYEIVDSKYDSVVEGMPEKMERYELLDQVDGIIKNNYYGSVDKDALSDWLIKGYMSALGDSNSRYMTNEEYAEYKGEIKGDMPGIGIEYEKTSKSQIKITKVYDGSPAKEQGLRKGDIIVAFDGIKLTSKNYKELSAKLEDESSSVNIIYKRSDSEKAVTLQKGYEAESVITGVYEKRLGYIAISDFYSGTSDQVSAALETFIASGINCLVLDLRENKSVNYDEAMETLDLFLPMTTDEKPAATVADNSGKTVRTYNMSPGEINLPIAVLVSSSTASAAEVFVSDMKLMSKCEIYGDESTKGDCLVQEIFELNDKGALLLSVGKISPYSGDGYEKTGITPDKIYEYEERNDNFKKDKLFLYAASLLMG